MADGSTRNTTVSTPLTQEQLKWKSRDIMAKALLGSHIEPRFRRIYLNVERSMKMWTVLRKD